MTDSCANLLDETIEKYDISILPLTFMSDGEVFTSYNKTEKSDLAAFFKMMREGKVFTTSLPKLDDSKNTLTELLEDGKDILFIAFSSALSGTFAAIDLICKELREAYPQRKILTIDSLAASMGQGLLVWKAAEMRESGSEIDEVFEWVVNNIQNVAHWFTVDDLMFLYRGGRVSKSAAFAGTMLNIKPILHVDEQGRLIPKEKVRGRKKSIDSLVSHMEKSATLPYADKVLISHGDCIEDAQTLKTKIQEKFGIDEIYINYIDPVIGAHSGPGTLALFYMASGRD